MARNDQIVRILVVAKALAESRRGISLKALAEKHGWAWRTVYRDVSALEQAGFPVCKEDGRYRLMDGWNAPTAPGIDDDERLALYSVRALAGSIRSTTLGRALDRLWMKLSTTQAGQTTLLPTASPTWFSIRSPISIDYRRHDKIIATFERAIRDHVAVTCHYRAQSTRTTTVRTIEPAELYWDPGLESLYVLAFCRLRQEVRVFAVHRFLTAALGEDKFVPRPEARSKTALKSAFRVWRSQVVETIRVRFAPEVADEIRERSWGAGQTIQEDAEGGRGGLVLTLEVAGLAEIERWILGFGAGAEVLGPVALVDRVRKAIRGAQARYDRPEAVGGVVGGKVGVGRAEVRRGPKKLSPDDNGGVQGGGVRKGT